MSPIRPDFCVDFFLFLALYLQGLFQVLFNFFNIYYHKHTIVCVVDDCKIDGYIYKFLLNQQKVK